MEGRANRGRERTEAMSERVGFTAVIPWSEIAKYGTQDIEVLVRRWETGTVQLDIRPRYGVWFPVDLAGEQVEI